MARSWPRDRARLIARIALEFWIELSVWAAPMVGFWMSVPPEEYQRGYSPPTTSHSGAWEPAAPLSSTEMQQWDELVRELG